MTNVITLGPLTEPDVVPLARLHRRAFPGFFLSSLGEPFLVQFYRGFLRDPSAVTVVARDSLGDVRGSAVGTLEPAGFYRRLLRQAWPGFVTASIQAVLVTPSAAPRLFRAVRYRGDARSEDDGPLLSSICVDPEVQGAGVGRDLIGAWTREIARRGGRTASLTTDAENNTATNAFYLGQGWRVSERFHKHGGRPMYRYTITLSDD